MKTNTINHNTQLINIITQRLSMQSTQNYLREYGIKEFNLKYFTSPAFQNYYNTWPETIKKSFLITLAGKFNWVAAREILES